MCDVCEPQERRNEITKSAPCLNSLISRHPVYLARYLYSTAIHDTYSESVSLTYPRATHVHVDAESLYRRICFGADHFIAMTIQLLQTRDKTSLVVSGVRKEREIVEGWELALGSESERDS